MTDTGPPTIKQWLYRFAQPDETVVETAEFPHDEAAEDRARELSKSKETPIVVHRHSAHVDGWEYVTEVDRRA